MAAPANPSPIPAATGAPHPQSRPNQRASDGVAVTTANALVSATAVTILRAGFIMRSVLLTLPPGEANEESRTPFPDGGMRVRAIAHKMDRCCLESDVVRRFDADGTSCSAPPLISMRRRGAVRVRKARTVKTLGANG